MRLLTRPSLLFTLLVCGGVGWYARTAAEPPWDTQLVPGKPYRVQLSGESTVLDLAFDDGRQYLLVVSSLADGEQTHRVELSSEPVSGPPLLPVRSLSPLKASPLRLDAEQPGAAGAPEEEQGEPPERRRFHLHVTEGSLSDPAHYARVSARRVGLGERVAVYLDERMRPSALAPTLVDEIVRLLDEEILPGTAKWLGGFRDVDGDGRLTVLLTPWLGRLQGGRTSLGGMARAADFDPDEAPPFGNRCDMLYLNTNLRPGRHLKTLLAHEYAHVVCFSRRSSDGAFPWSRPDEEDWLSEAVAHVAETREGGGWSNLDYRVSRFLSSPERFPLVVPDYYQAGRWRDHGCRGATFLFLDWCVDTFGDSLPGRLAASPATGTRSLAAATGVPFAELYRHWTVALARSGRTTPVDEPEAGHIDLRAPLGAYGLAGPRTKVWRADDESTSLELQGTASAFVRVVGSPAGEHRRIRVQGAAGSRLQVTLIPLADTGPGIQTSATWSAGEDPGLRVHVQPAEDGDCVVEALACEVNDDRGHNSVLRVAPWQDAPLPSSGRTLQLDLPRSFRAANEVTVKVVVRDSQGRRGADWTTLANPVPTAGVASKTTGSRQ